MTWWLTPSASTEDRLQSEGVSVGRGLPRRPVGRSRSTECILRAVSRHPQHRHMPTVLSQARPHTSIFPLCAHMPEFRQSSRPAGALVVPPQQFTTAASGATAGALQLTVSLRVRETGPPGTMTGGRERALRGFTAHHSHHQPQRSYAARPAEASSGGAISPAEFVCDQYGNATVRERGHLRWAPQLHPHVRDRNLLGGRTVRCELGG